MAELITARARGRIRGSVRIEMPDLGSIYVDETGARENAGGGPHAARCGFGVQRHR